MSNNSRLTALEQGQVNLNARILGINYNNVLWAAMGDFVRYGCKVTEGDSASDMVVSLEGQASGDSAYLNPNISGTPTRSFQYPNIAHVLGGAFVSSDTTATVEAAPSAGTARYDIAYVFAGKEGAGFGIAAGTPSASVLSDFGSNGLQTGEYGQESPDFDPVLPAGALPVARIYVAPSVTAITDSVIADLRAFNLPTEGTVTSIGISLPTGLQASGSPVTGSGTLAVTFTSGYSIPTDASQSNWTTAFNWGDWELGVDKAFVDALGVDAATLGGNSYAATESAWQAYVTTQINNLLDGAPAALDTLNELAAAIDDNASYAATVTASLAGKQPLDATLTAFAGTTVSADKLVYANGSDSFATTDLTAFARNLLDDADAATMRATLDLEIGTDVQAFAAQVSSGEKTAGTETAVRTFSPKDVADMAGTHGGGGATSGKDYQEFTSSGTWTKPSGATMVYVEVIGGGGSGSASISSAARGGGGGGSFISGFFEASDLGGTETVTIGAGGAAVQSTSSAGNDGGNTTFGAHLTGNGGEGGEISYAGKGGFGEPGNNSFAYSAGGGGYGTIATGEIHGSKSVEGGGGGGGCQDVDGGTGGVSQKGGNGGNGVGDAGGVTPGGSGTAPGGGGGAAGGFTGNPLGNTSGAGADGICRVWTWTDGS